MAKIITRQKNNDGSITFAYRDEESKKVVVCTGVNPHISEVLVVVGDKLTEVLKDRRWG